MTIIEGRKGPALKITINLEKKISTELVLKKLNKEIKGSLSAIDIQDNKLEVELDLSNSVKQLYSTRTGVCTLRDCIHINYFDKEKIILPLINALFKLTKSNGFQGNFAISGLQGYSIISNGNRRVANNSIFGTDKFTYHIETSRYNETRIMKEWDKFIESVERLVSM